MTSHPALGLRAEDVHQIFPFHIAFDERLRVLQFGAALRKLIPGVEPGSSLADLVHFEPPLAADFRVLHDARANLIVLRAIHSGALLRGQLVADPSSRALLLLCSPWLTSTSELHRLGLELSDFALHDPMSDLLQVLQAQEATLADVRKLVTKLSAQRKEQRAAAANLSALYEVTRLLAEGSPIASVATPVLERLSDIMKLPIATLWLHDSNERFVYHHVSAATGEAEKLIAMLHELPPDLSPGAWLATSRDSILCLAPGAEGRGQAAVTCGYSFAYQIQIVGASSPLGAFELYGTGAPPYERARLDTAAEIALRMGQYLDKVRADDALRSSIQIAAAAAAAKSQFLAKMSHEIRTPINGVLGMLELVLSSSLGEKERAQLQTARASGELLLDLVNDVLDFSKIEAGHLEINPLPFDLHRCLQRAHGLFKSRAEAKAISLLLNVDPAIPSVVSGDELRISQVLMNLISNAVKFTKVGSVTIEASLIDEGIEDLLLAISVRDSGIGIPEDRLDAVFSAFTQADAGTSREFGGTGLGLAICKQLVELMGGDLTVSSVSGEGSEFRFTLRVLRVEEHDVPGESATTDDFAARPLHILVVEDNEINQEVARGLLEREGHTVQIAGTMEDAITQGCDGVFDAILMDVQLPDGNGLTATIAIRNHARRSGRPRVPIIGLSAQAVAGDRERALAVGMDDYLTKPIRPKHLIQTLAALGALEETFARGRRTTSAALRARIAKLTDGRARGARANESHGWSADDQASVLEKVKEYGGLEGVLLQLIGQLAEEAPRTTDELCARVKRGDRRGAEFLAHRLVGSSGTIGARSLEQAARVLESSLRSAEPGELTNELAALRTAVESLASFVASDRFVEISAVVAPSVPDEATPAK
ncbi:MAG: ATP-binding protein [Kofleriaceae bacterium]